ncbi:MAG: aspartate dehydrogenase [Pseudomonadota bacterium]
MNVLDVVLIGYGAIGQAICRRLQGSARVNVTHVVVRPQRLAEVQAALGSTIKAVSEVPAGTKLALECAGHEALAAHVVGALEKGVECAVMSVGALSEAGLPEKLTAAASHGKTQVHLLAGAIGGIDAIAAARQAGLTNVTYTGRKPPGGWKGSAAEKVVDLASLKEAATIFEGTAREAASLYPKNANVAATVSLAGLGLDATRVRLIADPAVTDNVHEIKASGEFGEMQVTMRGKPLAENPKTSALTVLSALRFLDNRASAITI